MNPEKNQGKTSPTVPSAQPTLVPASDGNRAYSGKRFLGKAQGEKRLQLSLAQFMLNNQKGLKDKPLTFVDYGCGDGWFSRALITENLVHKESHGLLFDLSTDMRSFARKNLRAFSNISVQNSYESLVTAITPEKGVDLVFLNMVDLCQPNIDGLKYLFRSVSTILKPDGLLFITTQNPLAQPGTFAHYQTRFMYSNQTAPSESSPILTRVEGVDGELLDFHRPIPVTLGALKYEAMEPLEVSTMDDEGRTRNCSLSTLGAQGSSHQNSDLWVPTISRSRRLLICRLDRRGEIRETDIPQRNLIKLDPKAAYMGVIAKKTFLGL